MFTIEGQALLNASAEEPLLTPDQAFRGLHRLARVTSAEHPELVPPDHTYVLLEDQGDLVIRGCVVEGPLVLVPELRETLERATFHGGRLLVRDFYQGWLRGIWTYLISTTAEGELQLKLTLVCEFVDRDPEGPEAAELEAVFRRTWQTLPMNVAAQVRQLGLAEQPALGADLRS